MKEINHLLDVNLVLIIVLGAVWLERKFLDSTFKITRKVMQIPVNLI